MNFFKNFPTVEVDLQRNGKINKMVNIFRSVRPLQNFIDDEYFISSKLLIFRRWILNDISIYYDIFPNSMPAVNRQPGFRRKDS